MSLLDTFITLLFLSAMLLCLVFMCRDWLRKEPRIHSRSIHSYAPLFPKVSGKATQDDEDGESKSSGVRRQA
jgi:hypothetical protein